MRAPPIQLLGSQIRLLHVAPDGAYSLSEWLTPAGSASPPLHLHRRTDEAIYVLRGELCLLVEEQQTLYGPGSFAFIRHGQRHTFWNPGQNAAAFLALISPSGLEAYFAELSAGLARTTSDEEANALRSELSTRHDVELVAIPPARATARRDP